MVNISSAGVKLQKDVFQAWFAQETLCSLQDRQLRKVYVYISCRIENVGVVWLEFREAFEVHFEVMPEIF